MRHGEAPRLLVAIIHKWGMVTVASRPVQPFGRPSLETNMALTQSASRIDGPRWAAQTRTVFNLYALVLAGTNYSYVYRGQFPSRDAAESRAETDALCIEHGHFIEAED